MKILAIIIGALLGLAFVAFGAMYFLHLMPPQAPPPPGSPLALFMGAMEPTGYFGLVKALEIIGGALVAIPRTRNLGLLVLGPIVINILAFQVFIMKGAMLREPVIWVIVACTLFLLWVERRAFAALVHRPTT